MANDPYTEFDCYKVLNVVPNAGPDEVHQAYRRATLRSHPDRGGTHDAQVRVNRAYEILKDPVLRHAHDRYWYRSRTPAPAPPPRERHPSSDRRSPSAQPRPPSQPLEHLYRRARACIDERRQDVARRKQTRLDETVDQFSIRFGRRKNARRASVIWSCALTAAAVLASSANFHGIWIAAGISWLWFAVHFSGMRIQGKAIRFDDPSWRDAIRAAATEKIEAEFRVDQENEERHHQMLASLSRLLSRSSSLADGEDEVARRITGTLFVMGYQPLEYDRQARILIFTDGQERLIVRYRHRAGAAINVTYVERIVEAMGKHRASTGLLFCTPGISGNGAAVASGHGIKCYTLEQMNEWIEQVSVGYYGGPSGDLLRHLNHVTRFIQSISIPLPYHGPRRYRG